MKRLILLLLLAPSFALAAPDFSAYQGDAVLIPVPGAKPVRSATFGGLPASAFVYQGSLRALAGVAPTKIPGIYNMRVTFTDGTQFVQPVSVLKKKFPVVILPVPEKLQETPQQLVSNLAASNRQVQSELAAAAPSDIRFRGPFGLPLANNSRIGSPFGELRKTGDQLIRHLGVDITAKTGTAIGAINAGIVKRSYYDRNYGNTVIIDHGKGIFSIYLHLDTRIAKEGDPVERGGLIGRVGQTGFAEAPHLHLSVKINGVSVDPLQFVRAFAL